MVSKTQNNFGFLCLGFIIGFVSGYHYTYRRKTLKVLSRYNINKLDSDPEPDPEPESEPEFEPDFEPDFESDSESGPVTSFRPRISGGDSTSVNYVTTYRDTYATLDELIKTKLEMNVGKKNGKMSLRQKYSLMEDYSYIISLPYSQACRLVAAKGYTLQVSSVRGSSQKISVDSIPDNTFGVEIQDLQYDFKMNTPSKDAVVVSITNVGSPVSQY